MLRQQILVYSFTSKSDTISKSSTKTKIKAHKYTVKLKCDLSVEYDMQATEGVLKKCSFEGELNAGDEHNATEKICKHLNFTLEILKM